MSQVIPLNTTAQWRIQVRVKLFASVEGRKLHNGELTLCTVLDIKCFGYINFRMTWILINKNQLQRTSLSPVNHETKLVYSNCLQPSNKNNDKNNACLLDCL